MKYYKYYRAFMNGVPVPITDLQVEACKKEFAYHDENGSIYLPRNYHGYSTIKDVIDSGDKYRHNKPYDTLEAAIKSILDDRDILVGDYLWLSWENQEARKGYFNCPETYKIISFDFDEANNKFNMVDSKAVIEFDELDNSSDLTLFKID